MSAGGQQIDSAQGDHGKNTLVNLKSKKSGAGSATRALTGSAITPAQGTMTIPSDLSVVGPLTLDGPTTPERIALYVSCPGLSQSATATCRYKITGASSWTTGHPLYRIQPGSSETPVDPNNNPVGSVDDAFAWPIIDLAPGNSYDIEVTVTLGASNVVKTLTTSTRSLPAAAGVANKTIAAGTSASAIATAFSNLVAGDVLELAAGTYDLSLTNGVQLNITGGTSDALVYIRGASRTGVILQNLTFDPAFPTRIIYYVHGSYVVVENLTIQGSGVDSAQASTCRGIELYDGNTNSFVTFRNITVTGVDMGIVGSSGNQSMLVYNNTLTGNNVWTPTFLNDNRTWNDDGIRIPGIGNCAFNNTLKGFGDSASYAVSSNSQPEAEVRSIHFYRNDIINGGDDGTEADYSNRNCTFVDNRLRNTMTFLSFDPVFGGPFLAARNISINVGRTPFKFNSPQSGYFIYNNTVIHTTSRHLAVDGQPTAEANWYQPNNGNQNYYGFRNNIMVYRGAGTQALRLDNSGHDPIDFDHNCWYPDSTLWRWPEGDYTSLAGAVATTHAVVPVFSGQVRRQQSDTLTVSNPWTVTVTLGSDYRTEVTTVYTPALSNGDAAKGSGAVISNITDGYSGALPDRGAIISGQQIPTYGDNSPSWASGQAVNEWREMPNSAMSLTPPSVNGGGNSPLNALRPWCGLAFDDRTSTLWAPACGGHSDKYGNEVMKMLCEADTPHWVEVYPSDTLASQGQPNSSGYYATGHPASTHTYMTLQFVKSRNRAMKFGAWGVASLGTDGLNVDGFDCNTAIGVNGWDAAGTYPNMTGISTPTAKDPATEDVYRFDRNNDVKKWTQATNTWSTVNVGFPPVNANLPTAVAFDSMRSRIFLLKPPTGTPVCHTFDPATGLFTSQTLTGTAAAAVLALGYGLGMVYVAAIDAYLVRARAAGGTVYKINASTFDTTAISTTGGGSISVGEASADPLDEMVYQKLHYSPNLRGIIYIPAYASNSWLLRTH